MNQHVKAANRARLLAGIIRGRADGHPQASALHLVARRLGQAARVLLDTADTDRAEVILWRARIAAPDPEAAIPTDVIGYVSAPLSGFNPGLPELRPANPLHSRRECELRARLLTITEAGYLDSRDASVATAAMAALIDVHHDHKQLAAEVDAHGRIDQRPTTYRQHDGRRTAQHLPGRLTVFEGPRPIAELPVPFGITPGEIWQLIRDAEPAAA